MQLNIKKLNPNATIPTRGTAHSAGLDLYAVIPHEDKKPDYKSVLRDHTAKIGTGISIEIPEGFFGAIFARSGLATEQGLRPANCVGVIDSDYRGEVIVPLYNDGPKDVRIHNGDRIAQLVILPCISVELNEVTELSDTARSAGGFGSTGQ